MQINYRANLVDLLKYLNLPLVAAEIGVAEGNFSRDLLEAGLEKLYSVDAWKTLPQAGDGGHDQEWHNKNYASAIYKLDKYKEKSIVLRGVSHEMVKQVPDNSLGLAYFDGDHSYLGVIENLEDWYPKVVSGGIISSHDYEMEQYGVKQAFKYFCEKIGVTEIHLLPENKKEDAGAFFIKP